MTNYYSEVIKRKRASLNLTQKELADALGLGKHGDRQIRRWENGETVPSVLEFKYIEQFAVKAPYKVDEMQDFDFTFIDLFAGIGGIRIPFQELGGRCVFTSEWDKFAQKTYKINFDDPVQGDIMEIDEYDVPNHDILLAGFPCQPFSQAGLKRGFEDLRGTLFFDIARILSAKRPKAFLLENVKQLKGHDKGKTLSKIKETLYELDYEVHIEVLRARDFGLPQNRERVFIVGFDKKIGGENVNFKFPQGSFLPTRVGDILMTHVDDKYTISDRLLKGHERRKEMHVLKGNGFGYSVFNKDSEYTNTISARYYKDGSEILIEQKGKNPRKLTPREAARLQGFSDDFIIPVSDSQAYKQFGNSVPVNVVRAVAVEMKEAMLSSGLLDKEDLKASV